MSIADKLDRHKVRETRMNLTCRLVGMEGHHQTSPLSSEERVMPRAYKALDALQDRVVVDLVPFGGEAVGYSDTYTVALTAEIVGRVSEIVFAGMLDEKRSLVDADVRKFVVFLPRLALA